MYPLETSSHDVDLVVVGGGLAGLSAAVLVAQSGRLVTLFEQAAHVGGRAATKVRDCISFNLGPHALYCRGQAFRLMRDLGVPITGNIPSPGKSRLLFGEDDYPLPRGPLSLAGSGLFSLQEKGTLVRFLMTLKSLDARRFDGVSLSDWVQEAIDSGNGARFLHSLFRVSTYADDAERMSAGVAIDQLRLALTGNVWYVNGGWQTLVDGLRARALAMGARIRTGARVTSVRGHGEGATIQTAAGEVVQGGAAVLAVPPRTACDLLDFPREAPLARWTASSVPVRAASLDVALSRLDRPGQRFALGLDRPYYFSVHSAAAKLAPEGISVVHVMKYLREESGVKADAVEPELERCLDRLQPGWRTHTITRRYLPSLTVAHSLPLASECGLAGRPAVSLAEHPNVFLAGDWVGPEGLLADAAAASARSAAQRVLAVLAQARADTKRESHHVAS
jgi:phytoene dehydrogenase-like protein